MDKYEAVQIANDYIQAKGFEIAAYSGLSEAIYLRRPNYSESLRIAAHACRHPFGVAAKLTIDYREAWERDEQRVAWIGSVNDLHQECDLAIAEYDANAEPDED